MATALQAAARKAEQDAKTRLEIQKRIVNNILDPAADPLDMSEISPLRRKQPTFVEPNLQKSPDDIKPLAKTVTFMPSQVGKPDQVSISYTATPLRLMWYDIQLVLGKLPSTMGIMKPWRTGKDADPFDEMYPSGRNLMSIGIHAILIVTQLVSSPTLPLLVAVLRDGMLI
jgi:hypothetical protein